MFPVRPATVTRAIFRSGSSTVRRWSLPVTQTSGSSHGSTISTPPGLEVSRHRRDRGVELVAVGDVPDRAEQARDGVEPPAEVEVRMSPVWSGTEPSLPAGDREQALVDVHALDLELGPERLEVLARAAGDVEQGARGRVAGADQLGQPRRLAGVVLERVERVVELGERVGHRVLQWGVPQRSTGNNRCGTPHSMLTAGVRRLTTMLSCPTL